MGIEPMASSGGFFLMGKLPIIPALHNSASHPVSPSSITDGSSATARLKSNENAAVPRVDSTRGEDASEPYDWTYCRYLAENHGVVGIPAAPFFSRDDYSAHYALPSLARFAFCKRDDTLHEAARRLGAAPRSYRAISASATAAATKSTASSRGDQK